jgi:hypothetical protein
MVMDLHFRSILVSLHYTDFTYQNPLPLKHEAGGPVIGKAELHDEKKKLFVNLSIEQHLDYLPLYPRLAVDVLNKQVGYVFLSKEKPLDEEVRILKEQIEQPELNKK